MKVIVPDYYKDFKCIAGRCEDTCCAGWEVDVDEESYLRYKQVKGELGERLSEVMIPKAEGEGCSFRLMPDKRCPFLNDKNLCDIYTELGEDALCETCTFFPRFVHDYGSVREMGPAPSCFTAAQLMVNKAGRTEFVTFEDKSIPVRPHDICPEAYLLLREFRKEVFDILWDESSHLHRRLIRILDRANVTQAELCDMLEEDIAEDVSNEAVPDNIILSWLKPFEGMEIINNGWMELIAEYETFCGKSRDDRAGYLRSFEEECSFAGEAFKQLLFYYFYRYILEAVHDGRLLCAVKTGIVAYLGVRELCAARYAERGCLSRDGMADIFHLYSRQVEHSDVNFEHYRDAYDNAPEYSYDSIIEVLKLTA